MISTRTLTRLFVCAVVVDGQTVDVYAANTLAFVNEIARDRWSDLPTASFKFTRSTRP